jgi:hypothetical protein
MLGRTIEQRCDLSQERDPGLSIRYIKIFVMEGTAGGEVRYREEETFRVKQNRQTQSLCSRRVSTPGKLFIGRGVESWLFGVGGDKGRPGQHRVRS